MSKLNDKAQQDEIDVSLGFLQANDCIDIKTYCHPYGGFHTFNEATINALNAQGVEFSLNVDARDIEEEDLRSSIQFLPRYDCNLFPYGTAS